MTGHTAASLDYDQPQQWIVPAMPNGSIAQFRPIHAPGGNSQSGLVAALRFQESRNHPARANVMRDGPDIR